MVTGSSELRIHGPLMGQAAGLLTLRVRDSEHDGRTLRIRSPKCSIGADRHATLRLRAVGVEPCHCLILRGKEGTFVRRWSGRTRLNGLQFTESRLEPGDRLTIGPIELEVLAPTPEAMLDAATMPPAECRPPESTASATHSSLESVDSEQMDRERTEHRRICDQWRSDYEELKSEYFERLEKWDHQRGELERRTEQLKRQLQSAEATQRRMREQTRAEVEKERKRHHESRGLIGQLREGMTQLRDTLHVQSAEQEKLVERLADSDRRELAMQRELEAAVKELEESRKHLTQVQDRSPEPGWTEVIQTLESETKSLKKQLQAATTELEKRQEEWAGQVAHWEARLQEQQVNSVQDSDVAGAEMSARSDGGPPGESAADRDLAGSLRGELEQTRSEHQRACEEWHADRLHLERELADRSQALQQSQAKHSAAIQEAESLVHSLQLEGKRLLLDLDNANQTIRQLTAQQKRLEDTESRSQEPFAQQEPASPPFVAADPIEPAPPADSTMPPVEDTDLRAPVTAATVWAPVPRDPGTPHPAAQHPAAKPCDTIPFQSIGVADEDDTDEEGAIQRYMERLLNRVARGSNSEEPPAVHQPRPLSPAREIVQPEPHSHAATPTPSQSAKREVPEEETRAWKSAEKVVPETAEGMVALRELANNSARQALTTSDRRRGTATAINGLALAGASLAIGSLAVATSSSVTSMVSVSGFVAIGFGCAWLVRGVKNWRTILKSKAKSTQEGDTQS